MEQEALYFCENDIIKNEVDIKTISKVLSNKKSYGNKDLFNYFIWYRHKGNAFPAPLRIKFPLSNAYAKYFDRNSKYIDTLVNYKEILEKYNKNME